MERKPGELTNEELNALVGHNIAREGPRAIATAAYKKAMRRAAEICRDELIKCAAAIEREAS